LFPVAGTVFITIGQNHSTAADWLWIGAGSTIILAAGGIQWIAEASSRRRTLADTSEAIRFRVAIKDALQPIVEKISEMPYLGKRDRGNRLGQVATSCTASLVLLLKDVYRVRAIVYTLSPNGRSMSCMSYHGRGQKPKDFCAGTDRGDRALEMVRTGQDLFVADINKSDPGEWRGSGQGYNTFISAAITAGGNSFGMITVDAPNAGDLVDTDRQIVLLVADLLAIAFAQVDAS
jgi:GAF domain-containing protein